MISGDEIEKLVLRAGSIFEGRLPDDVLQDAMEYVQFGECKLAMEVLCAQIAEYGVPVTDSDLSMLDSAVRAVRGESEWVDSLRNG